MSKRPFKSQASSSRLDPESSFGGSGSVFAGTTLSYISEPPGLSSITDANVVVAFKNLTKKDSTTKYKGLEDLRLYIQSHPNENGGGVEQPILEAWIKLYPRLSIDNSRRVRELSHSVQYELLRSARKRMEKYIPSIVGPWLAGVYDRDRPVSKTAIDGINSFLDSEDKVLLFWKRCQSQILAYAQEAIKETPHTLSDERNVTADDVQAKYDRVMGSSLSLVLNLLLKLSNDDIKKQREEYEGFLSKNKTLWGFIACQDSFLRRASALLLLVCLEKERDIIEQNLEIISHAFLSEGLRSPQSGSSLQFLQALNKATDDFPQIWLSAYKGKKPALSRLRQFIGKGSQGGRPQYWQSLGSLILKLPLGVLPTDLDGAIDFLKAYREGMSSREEARTNASAAWHSYIDVVGHISSSLADPDMFEQLLRVAIFPAFEGFLYPDPNQSSWSIGASLAILPRLFNLCYISATSKFLQSLQEEWIRLAESLVTKMRMSLPEQSKDYTKSQTAVTAEAHRWFELQAYIIDSASAPESKISEDLVIEFLKTPSSRVVNGAKNVLKNRNGKLDSAAGTIEIALKLAPKLIRATTSIQDDISSVLVDEFPRLVVSPSSQHLIATLFAFQTLPNREPQFKAIWQAAVDGLLATTDDHQKAAAVSGLIAHHSTSQLAQRDPDLQRYLLGKISSLIKGSDEDWVLFENSLAFDSLYMETLNRVMSTIVDSLNSRTDSVNAAFRAMELVVRKNPQLLQNGELKSVTIMTRLLALTESSAQGVVSRANLLKAQIEQAGELLATKSPGPLNFSPTLDILRENLENAGPQSLAADYGASIDTLVRLASDFLDTENSGMSKQIFPNTAKWSQALMPLLDCAPDSSLALTSSVGPSLVQPISDLSPPRPPRDTHGFSVPFRMALYTAKLLVQKTHVVGISVTNQVELLRLLSLTAVLASDQLGLGERNKLWASLQDLDVERQVSDFLQTTEFSMSEQFSDATSWRSGDVAGSSAVAQKLIADLLAASNGDSPSAFYSARALSNVVTHIAEKHGWKTSGSDEWLSSLDILKISTSNVFAGVAILSGLQEFLGASKLVSNLCNRLLSEIIDASCADVKTLRHLILLNATLAIYGPQNLPIAQNRIMFAVKHIIGWLHEDNLLPFLVESEALRCLWFLMPALSALYGPHWEVIINYCIRLWNDHRTQLAENKQLPALNASLRLLNLLKGLNDPNEDLSEALEESVVMLSNGLVQLLKLKGRHDSQPWQIFDELLWRESCKIPYDHIKQISAIYPLLASEFRLVQLSAFDILGRAIPATQEQISIDVILEKRDAQFPAELLSLLLDAPSIENYSDEDLTQFPLPIKTFLFSWKLVFSSYPNASEKVRNDYNEALKSENYITPLLDFLFDVLGHSGGQPLNLEKAKIPRENIQLYDAKIALSEPEETHLRWLLVHLYHQCLKFAPSLAKSWWMNCKSKQTRMAVESWTEKYFSSLIIAETIDDVIGWAEQQEEVSDDDKEMIVKSSKNAREIYAGFEIDEVQMQIAIRLPASYPLEGAKVDGVNRVAITEKKWQSWLLITQGVIAFSNSSITEGLIAFRKNVTGALKGQTECAICYSIVSADNKMAEKRCQTCKNLFHTSCLFKWFASSNQSSCPLCRNPFPYGAGSDIGTRARRRGGPE